ncbi:Kinesin-like protein KIN-10B [Senna tora]|uniref:Kinesin-like protein KIN-10B n=1 Tax=Senna tora TaxID=362788 RepID=A0A834TSD7_9FABA|nr:Kinesin-like protein KIN-10B [Senna tora]
MPTQVADLASSSLCRSSVTVARSSQDLRKTLICLKLIRFIVSQIGCNSTDFYCDTRSCVVDLKDVYDAADDLPDSCLRLPPEIIQRATAQHHWHGCPTVLFSENGDTRTRLLHRSEWSFAHFLQLIRFSTYTATCIQGLEFMAKMPFARNRMVEQCLVQEYIDFLNNASRNELVRLKGMGEKMAEYIIDLREESPIKSVVK